MQFSDADQAENQIKDQHFKMAVSETNYLAEKDHDALPDIRYNHLHCSKNGSCGDVPHIEESETLLVGQRHIREDEKGDRSVSPSHHNLHLKLDFYTEFRAIRPTTAV